MLLPLPRLAVERRAVSFSLACCTFRPHERTPGTGRRCLCSLPRESLPCRSRLNVTSLVDPQGSRIRECPPPQSPGERAINAFRLIHPSGSARGLLSSLQISLAVPATEGSGLTRRSGSGVVARPPMLPAARTTAVLDLSLLCEGQVGCIRREGGEGVMRAGRLQIRL